MPEPSTRQRTAAEAARDALRQQGAEVIVRVGESEVLVPELAVVALAEALAELADGHTVRVLRADCELTTQEAADILNLSRPHFVRLLDQGKLPFHMVGTHHRLLLPHVLAYKASRSAKREAAFQVLANEGQKHGLGS